MLGTQELDAADILEVTDLAHAIAKAEEAIRAQSRRADTDDAMGPAVHAPTPLPPRVGQLPLPAGVTRPATLLRAPEMTATPMPAPISTTSPAVTTTLQSPAFVAPGEAQPSAAVASSAAARTAPILVLDEDAFYHPAGRIRSLADTTLDGYRPEPTLMMRLRQRRRTLSKIALALLIPLSLLAIFTVAVAIGRATAEREAQPPPAQPATTTPPTPAAAPTPTVAAVAPAPKSTAKAPAPASTDEIPVFDVRSLKSVPPPAPHRPPRHRTGS